MCIQIMKKTGIIVVRVPNTVVLILMMIKEIKTLEKIFLILVLTIVD